MSFFWNPFKWGKKEEHFTHDRVRYVTHSYSDKDWYNSNSAVRAVIDTVAQAVATVPVKFYTPETAIKRFTLEEVTPDPYTLLFNTSTALLRGFDVELAITAVGEIETAQHEKSYVSRAILSGDAWQTKLDALEAELYEAYNSGQYRAEMWAQGGRIAGWLSLPADKGLSDEARKRLQASWHDFSRGGARAGQTPILEDGLQYHEATLSAKENEWEASQRLLLQHVANVYNLPLAILTGGASERERAYMYSDTINGLVKVITAGLTRLFNRAYTVRFNIDSKLSGSFLERAQILSTLAGRPVLTLNEARAIIDYPETDGENIVTPLNVTEGGKLSPQDGADILPYYENMKQLTDKESDNDN